MQTSIRCIRWYTSDPKVTLNGETLQAISQRMGRRAADPTTPVPVLGVPALVGVRSWRKTGGNTAGGAQLQTWGLQSSSVGVQTSPGIRRAPSEQCAQLMYKLHTQSAHSARTANSYITKEYKEILLLTNGDKAKSGDFKGKKEVSFQELVGETLGDVACNRDRTSRTPGTIKATPHSARTVTKVGPGTKPTVRYANGSVVDSEAMGGISIENGESTPTHGGHRKRMHTHYTESRKMLLFSTPKPFGGSQKICNQCGGKRAAGVDILGKKILPASACQRENQFHAGHDVLHFSKRLQLPHNETDVQPSNHQLPENSRSGEKETSPQQGSHLQETPRRGKIRHAACPVHSIKAQFFTHGHSVASTDSQTIHTNSVTVTEATIDTKKVDTVDTTTTIIPLDIKIPQKGLLPSTPLMATATKSNHPHIQTHSKFHHNALQKVCVSVHATQENTPSHLYTTSKGNATGTIPKTVQAFNTTLMSAKRTAAFPHREIILQNSPHSPRQIKTKEVSQASPPLGSSDPQKPETQATPINPSHTSFAQAKLNSSSSMVLTCPVNPNVNSKEATIACGTHDPKSLDANKQPVSSNSELTRCGKETFLNESCATLDSTLGMSAPVSVTTNYALYRNAALRSSSNIHPSSTLKVNRTNSRVSYHSLLKTSNMSHEHNQSINHNTFPRPDEPCQTQTTDITSEPISAPAVPNQKNVSKAAQASLGASKVSESDHVSIVSQTVPNRTDNSSELNSESHPDEKLSSGDRINDLLGNGSKQPSGCVSQDATPQSSICPIKSNSLRLRGCIKAKQQTGERYQGSTVIEHKGQCVTCPTGTTAQQMDSNTEEFASGVSPMHANSRTDSNADKQKHPNYPTASKGKREPIISTLPNRNAHSDLKHMRSLESNKSTFQQSLKGPKLSLIAPALRCSEGELCTHCNSASLRRLGSSEAEAIVSRDSKRAPKQDAADLILAHSHPSEAAQFLLSSPRCGKSATMQHRLESVEASLAANKDRITTLLNIIHDLEASHAPAHGQQYNKAGQDLKNCSTCQKTACIVYSVEYDFRQQERCFLEVLNLHLTRRNTANRVYQSRALNFSLLRKAVKNVKKSKKKSEKLYKVLLKWLPGKMEQV